MEYIAHGDLEQYLKEHGPKAAAEAKQITSQILEGLVVLHEREICHRDLKPKVTNNSLIQETGDAYTFVEHSHSTSLAYMGKDYRFWNLQTGSGHIVKNQGWHNLLPSPGAARTTAKGNEGQDVVHQGCRYLGPRRCGTRDPNVGNSVPRLVRTHGLSGNHARFINQ